MTTQMITAGELGTIGAEAIRELSSRIVAGRQIADYSLVDASWETIADGGWDLLGRDDDAADGMSSLRDLVEIAIAWGDALLPLPYIETLWCKRWSSAAREVDGPVSVSVPRYRGRLRASRPQGGLVSDEGVAPLAGPDVPAMVSVGLDADTVRIVSSVEVDDFAANLRLAHLPFATRIAPEARNELAVLWAAECVGAGRRLLQASVDYAKTREQFGQPIGRFQAVKHRLADMHLLAEAADTAVIWASNVPSDGAATAQLAIDSSIRLAESAIQVHGGMGFTWELGLHCYLRSMLVRRELVSGLFQ